MYKQGHYAKVRRPTGPELYEDASKILDNLLQKQLNEQRMSHGRPPRYRTHPFGFHRPITTGEVLDERDEAGLDEGIERCRTMPSRMRDEPLRPRADGESSRKGKEPAIQHGDTSASSADTEGDSSTVSDNRKKKGLLRRAKDRLIHSFHRQEREKENRLKGKGKDSPKASPKNQPKKVPRGGKKKPESEQNGVGGEGGGGGSMQFVDGSSKRRNSVSKALSNIRKSFRSKKDREGRQAEEARGDKRSSPASTSATSRPSPDRDSNTSSIPAPVSALASSHDRLSVDSNRARFHHSGGGGGSSNKPDSHPPAPPPSASRGGSSGVGGGPYSSLSVPAAASSDGRKVSSHSVSPYPHSSSTDSHLGNGDVSSSVHSFASHHGKHNALDYPADDIEFMDGDEQQNGDAGHYAGGGGGGGRRFFRQQSSLCVDGESDVEDGKPRPPKSVDDVPLHERTSEEKEEMYGKIAQKLITIADNFAAESGISDAEGGHREGAAAGPFGLEGDGVLTDLEKQILECLRAVGDAHNDKIDGHAETMIEHSKAQMYERFKSTMQHSLGNDLSWNSLALLFYTTKGVVTAVGKGSQLAGDAKEMTLRYFSDRFAKWLMDQGGFDSVLSESDSELD